MGISWGHHIVRGICRQKRPRSAIGWKGRGDHWLVGRGGGGRCVVHHRKGDPLTIASPFLSTMCYTWKEKELMTHTGGPEQSLNLD